MKGRGLGSKALPGGEGVKGSSPWALGLPCWLEGVRRMGFVPLPSPSQLLLEKPSCKKLLPAECRKDSLEFGFRKWFSSFFLLFFFSNLACSTLLKNKDMIYMDLLHGAWDLHHLQGWWWGGDLSVLEQPVSLSLNPFLSSSATIISFGQGILEKLKCLLYKTDIKFLLQGAKFVLSWSKTRLHLAVSRVCH